MTPSLFSNNFCSCSILQLKALGKGSYLLRVKGQEQEGHNFTDESYVSVERSNNLIFVQNDKPLYKLGDNVKFRLIVIDLALKPVQTPLDVKIYVRFCLTSST